MVRRAILLVLAFCGIAKADTGFTSTIRVTETDNSPACTVGQVKVSPGSLTCNGQVATITTGGSGGGGGGASSLEVFAGAVRSSPTASISLNPSDFSSRIHSGTTFYFALNPATTDFIHNQSTLQTGSTAYPDFLYVGSSVSIGGGITATRISGVDYFSYDSSTGKLRLVDGAVPLSNAIPLILWNNNSVVGNYTGIGFAVGSSSSPTAYWYLDSQNSRLTMSDGSGNVACYFDTTTRNLHCNYGIEGSTIVLRSFNSTSSSTTATGSDGLYSVYETSVGSVTLRNVASGTQCLHADASGHVTGTGSDCGSGGGGGGTSTQEVFVGPARSSPTPSITAYTGDFIGSVIGGTTFQFALNPATTDFIQNQTTSVQNATFSVSSGSVGNFTATDSTMTNITTSKITATTISLTGQGNTRILFMNGANLGSSSNFTWNGTTITAPAANVNGAAGLAVGFGISAASATLSTLSASQYVKTDGAKTLVSQSGIPAADITGTLNIGTQSNLTASGQAVLSGSNVGVPQTNLSTGVVGNLPVTNLNSGTSASGSTFWRGDGTWATPSASGGGGDNLGSHIATMTVTANYGLVVSTIVAGAASTSLGNNPYVKITSSGTSQALLINSYGQPSGGYQNQIGAVTIISTTTEAPGSGITQPLLVLVDSTTDAQVGTGLIELWANNANHNDPKMWFHVTGHDSSPEIRDDAGAPNWEMINTSTDNAKGMGKWEPAAIAFTGVDLQVNSRAYDNSTFENVAYWQALQKDKDQGPGLYIRTQDTTNDSGVMSSSSTGGINFYTLNSHIIGLTGPKNPASASWRFGLPSTPNNLGQVLYQSTNSDGTKFGDRQWEFTTGGVTGQVLQYNSGSAPTWVTASGGGGSSTLAVTTGTATTYSNPAISSPTAVVALDQAQFGVSLIGATTVYVSISRAISSVSGNFTIGSTSTVVLADATGASLTVTLPTAVGISGRVLTVKRTNSGANTVTVATTSSQTIDGALTQVLTSQYTSLDFISDGSNWSLL